MHISITILYRPKRCSMLVQIIKQLHICKNKIMPASKFDQILFGDRSVRGYIAFEENGGDSIAHVLADYDAVVVPDMLQVVQGEHTGYVGTPIEAMYDVRAQHYDKPQHLYLLVHGSNAVWVPVKYCRPYTTSRNTRFGRFKRLCGLE